MQSNTDDDTEDVLQMIYTAASGPAPGAPAPTTSAGAPGGSSPGGHSCSSAAAGTTPLASPRGVVEAAGKLRDLLAGGVLTTKAL